jgi:Tol biopolymer transport system component
VHSRDPQFKLPQTGAFPTFSPDGKHIAFSNSGFRVGGTTGAPSSNPAPTQIYIADVDGSHLRGLYADETPSVIGATWSQTGDRIAFGIGVGGQGATDIFVMRADGSDVRRLTDDAAEEGTPAFAWK